jgi:hypothetical protein
MKTQNAGTTNAHRRAGKRVTAQRSVRVIRVSAQVVVRSLQWGSGLGKCVHNWNLDSCDPPLAVRAAFLPNGVNKADHEHAESCENARHRSASEVLFGHAPD